MHKEWIGSAEGKGILGCRNRSPLFFVAKKNLTGRARLSRRTHMFRISVSPGDWKRNPGSVLAAGVSAGETPLGREVPACSELVSREHGARRWLLVI